MDELGAAARTGGILLLAAGQSRRFGSQKLLHPLHDKRPLILHSIELAQGAELPVTVVTDGKQAELVSVIERSGVDCLALSNADDGMGANLARAVAARGDWEGWLVMLADMPFIALSTLQQVLEQANPQNIIVPTFSGRRGHPVWFGSAFKNALIQLRGDQGGRQVLADHRDRLIELEVSDPAIGIDIDTPADLAYPSR